MFRFIAYNFWDVGNLLRFDARIFSFFQYISIHSHLNPCIFEWFDVSWKCSWCSYLSCLLRNVDMKINLENTKVMIAGKADKDEKFMGGIINSEGNLSDEIIERITKLGRLLMQRKLCSSEVRKIVKPTLKFWWTITERRRSKIIGMEKMLLWR